jgi:hypothetical protein
MDQAFQQLVFFRLVNIVKKPYEYFLLCLLSPVKSNNHTNLLDAVYLELHIFFHRKHLQNQGSALKLQH